MMDVNKLMSYIDNLTPQQAGGYLSGQQPFPYADMPRELWAPRMAAAAHQKLAAGGLVRRMDDRMAEMLARRFYEGGRVQGYAAGGTPEEPQVYSLDAEGRSLGKRKLSAAPLAGEVSVEPVPTAATPRTTAKLGVFDKEGKLIGRRFSSEPLLKNEQFVEPLTAGLAVPSVGTELGRAYDSGVDLITAVPRSIADMGGAVAQNYRRQQALREGGKNSFTQGNAQDILNSIAQDEAGLKEAIAKGQIPQQPQEQRDANAKFMAEQGPANAVAAGSQIGAGVRGVAGMPEITMPAARNSADLEAELAAIPKAKTDTQNIEGIKALMPADRTKERMARLTEAQKGLGTDRERDIWLSILQGAGAGMASGNRSFLGSLGTTVEKGAAGAAAAEKDYRTRKAGLEEKQMKIEDASDAMARDVATQGMAMTKEQRKEYLAAQVSKYGLSKDQFDNAVKLAELKLKQLTTQSEIKYRDALGSAKAAGGNAFTAEDKTKMILAQKKVIMEKNPGISDARAQEMARSSVEQSIAEAMGMSGQGGGIDFVDALPKGKTALR